MKSKSVLIAVVCLLALAAAGSSLFCVGKVVDGGVFGG